MYGRPGSGVSAWAPAGEEKKRNCINDVSAAVGFLVVHLAGD